MKVAVIEASGRKRGFRFGTYQMGKAAACDKCDIIEMLKRIDAPGSNISTVLNFLYAAAVTYCEGNKEEVDFTVIDVSDWLDEVGLTKGMELIREGLATPNSPAPQPAGQ